MKPGKSKRTGYKPGFPELRDGLRDREKDAYE